MKKTIYLFALVIFLLLVSCTKPAEKITITSPVILEVNQTYQIETSIPTILYTYHSSDENIIKVDNNGLVIALSVGHAFVNVSYIQGITKIHCDVNFTIIEPKEEFYFTNQSFLYVNNSLILTTNLDENEEVLYNSNSELVDITYNTLTALAEGQALIEAYYYNNEIKVSTFININIASLNFEEFYIILEDVLYVDTQTILSNNLNIDEVLYTSSNESIAKIIDTNTLLALSVGTVIITANVNIENYVYVSSIILFVFEEEHDEFYIDLPNKIYEGDEILIQNNLNVDLVYTSSNSDVAIIKNDNILFAISKGITIIETIYKTPNYIYSSTVVINVETKTEKFKLGIDNLDNYLSLFEGKKVGLITNPTGFNSNLESTIDILFEHPKINLVALFSPEHGIRGEAQAGDHIGNYTDEKTGLTVYSLYGSSGIPTKPMMDQLDVLCIDIQDVGARFYTYIYTMAYAMQACKTYDKEFVVFDRPNPVSNVAQGTILDTTYSSFIGMYPILTRHGMTIGEVARFFKGEYSECDSKLSIVKMSNYDNTKYYDELGLPWIKPSPNIPTVETAIIYTATCIFEGTNLSEGRGTTTPFQTIGAPYINAPLLVEELNKLKIPGVVFVTSYFTPTMSKHNGVACKGFQIIVTDRTKFESVKTGFIVLYKVIELHQSQFSFLSSMNLLTGGNFISTQQPLSTIFTKIENDQNTFIELRKPYILY